MNNFLIIRFKDPAKSIDYPAALFEPYLVSEPSKTKVWKSLRRATLLYTFLVNHRIERKSFYADEQAAITFDGFPLLRDSPGVSDHYHRDLFSRARQGGEYFLKRIYGEFSLAIIEGDNVLVTTNLGGSHMVYYTENEDYVAITNRSPLLMAIPQFSCELSVEASCSSCYQGYITDELTPFKNIRKLVPGSVARVDPEGCLKIDPLQYSDLIDQDIAEGFKANPLEQFGKVSDSIIQYLYTLQSYYDDLPFTVPLSGGKDSRLILALLLKAGLSDKIQSIWTRGPLYSPDVIAAKDLCETIGYREQEIRRPSVISSNQVDIRIVCNSLNYHEGNLSLYDLQGISNNRFITVSGHQNALRPGSFSSCCTENIDLFINDSLSVRFHDPLGILNEDYRKGTRERYIKFFSSCYEEGAPISDLGDLYYLRQRNANWVAVFCNSDYYSGPFTNPLLIGDIYRFIFSLPKIARENELLHFLCMHYCKSEFLTVPFANQAWNANMSDALMSLGIKMHFSPLTPYRSHESFPNMSNPYITSLKVEYVNALRPVITMLLEKHRKYYCEFMHVDKFIGLIENAEVMPFRDLYSALGVYANVLIKEYAPGIFKRSARQSIIEDIESMMAERVAVTTSGADAAKPIAAIYEEIIERHENCISQLTRQAQLLNKNKISDQRPLLEKPKPRPWRHVYITNETSDDVTIFMIIGNNEAGESRKTPLKKLVPLEEFKYGFQEEVGSINLFFKDHEGFSQCDQFVQSVPIKTKQFKYNMKIASSCFS